MASSSGNSLGSSKIQSSGSEEDLHLGMDRRKRKRMLSNRESARRSRLRKQKHLNDLMAQLTELKKENTQILDKINITTQHYLHVEAQNSIVKAQMAELSQRLQSLNDILSFHNNSTATSKVIDTPEHAFETGAGSFKIHHMNLRHLGQPIMASADMFQW